VPYGRFALRFRGDAWSRAVLGCDARRVWTHWLKAYRTGRVQETSQQCREGAGDADRRLAARWYECEQQHRAGDAELSGALEPADILSSK
jgi:hypothetical protein